MTDSWLHCTGRRIARILRQTNLPLGRPFPAADPAAFQQSLLGIHEELTAYRQPDEVIVGNLIENALRHQARRQGARSAEPIPAGLLAVRRLISTAPTRRLTLAEMAKLAGMSVSHFSLSFKRAFDLPPMTCLIQNRLQHAALLLSHENLTISEIAARVGYEDLFHFSKQFKKHFGVSPQEMRRRTSAPA